MKKTAFLKFINLMTLNFALATSCFAAAGSGETMNGTISPTQNSVSMENIMNESQQLKVQQSNTVQNQAKSAEQATKNQALQAEQAAQKTASGAAEANKAAAAGLALSEASAGIAIAGSSAEASKAAENEETPLKTMPVEKPSMHQEVSK
jgi:uncharacterized membrane protein